MKRWTLLIIPHGTEATRSYSVSERALRGAAWAGVAVLLMALIGAGSLLARSGRPSPDRVATLPATAGLLPPPEVVELRSRVAELRGILGAIRQEDARLRSAVGAPGMDTTTLLRRFLARLPRVLRPGRPAGTLATGGSASGAAAGRDEATGATAAADSLLGHAAGLVQRYRGVGPRSVHLDSLDVLSLRPESLKVALGGPGERVKRSGRVIHWAPRGSGALLAGFNAEVTQAWEEAGVWRIDLRSEGGLVATLSAPGQLAVRPGERISADQPVIVVPASSPGATPSGARYELRRNGIMLDPTFPGSLGFSR